MKEMTKIRLQKGNDENKKFVRLFSSLMFEAEN